MANFGESPRPPWTTRSANPVAIGGISSY
jgi:hypothetical protein